MTERNPQGREMADESMVRNLAAQATAIWPQEEPLFRRYAPEHILDLGCGTGEITSRLVELFPQAKAIGVDIIDAHLDLAREKYARFGERLSFAHGDAFELDYPDHHFDLSVCRHMLQSIPDPQKVLAEMIRVTRPGGWLHVLAEDYGMIACASEELAKFWLEAPLAVGRSMNVDSHIGRHVYGHLQQLPVEDVRMDYVTIDPTRTPRSALVGIFTAWRDGFVPVISQVTGMGEATVKAIFDATIEEARSGFVAWTIPIASARVV